MFNSPAIPAACATGAYTAPTRIGTLLESSTILTMDDDSAARERLSRRLRSAFDLQRFGIAMMRQNLVRRHPAETEAEIDDRLRAWLRARPGAEHGDAVGRPGSWPRDLA